MARVTLAEQLALLQQAHKELQESHWNQGVTIGQQESAMQQLQAENGRLSPLQETIRTQAAKIEELEKKLKEKTSSYDYKSQELQKAEGELEQAHAVLDGVSGAPSREYEQVMSYGGTSTHKRNVVTRLAGAFLAIAQKTPAALG